MAPAILFQNTTVGSPNHETTLHLTYQDKHVITTQHVGPEEKETRKNFVDDMELSSLVFLKSTSLIAPCLIKEHVLGRLFLSKNNLCGTHL